MGIVENFFFMEFVVNEGVMVEAFLMAFNNDSQEWLRLPYEMG